MERTSLVVLVVFAPRAGNMKTLRHRDPEIQSRVRDLFQQAPIDSALHALGPRSGLLVDTPTSP
jgi:hypothetical protein